MSQSRSTFDAVRLEGGLVTPELLRKVHARVAPGQSAIDYDLSPDARVIDEIRDHWDRLRRTWAQWTTKEGSEAIRSDGTSDSRVVSTRDLWQ